MIIPAGCRAALASSIHQCSFAWRRIAAVPANRKKPHRIPRHPLLNRLQVRNFKVFSDADIELGPVTVLCGPNNSGKTAALQAIALWQLGLRAWQAERGRGSTARARRRADKSSRSLLDTSSRDEVVVARLTGPGRIPSKWPYSHTQFPHRHHVKWQRARWCLGEWAGIRLFWP